MLEKSVAAAAVIVLGLVASLNFVDQNTMNKVTSHPLYQQWLGDAPSESVDPAPVAKEPAQAVANAPAQTKAPMKAPTKAPMKAPAGDSLSMADIKNKVVGWIKAVDVEELKAKGEVYWGKAERLAVKTKAYLVAQYQKLTAKKKPSDKTAKGSAAAEESGA